MVDKDVKIAGADRGSQAPERTVRGAGGALQPPDTALQPPDTALQKKAAPPSPPDYRPAAFSQNRCGTCAHYVRATGRCKQFKADVDSQYVCDAFEPQVFKPSTTGTFKMSGARLMVLKMAAPTLAGGALSLGNRYASDVDALGSPIARPGTPANAARTVQPAAAQPLTPAMPQAPAAMGAAPRHTPPPVQGQMPVQQPKMARAERRSILKEADAQPAPPPPAPGGAPAPPPGAFKPSPLAQVLQQWNPTPANKWLDSIHSKMNQPAPPAPSDAEQAASGSMLANAQQLQGAYQQSGPGKTANARRLVLVKLSGLRVRPKQESAIKPAPAGTATGPYSPPTPAQVGSGSVIQPVPQQQPQQRLFGQGTPPIGQGGVAPGGYGSYDRMGAMGWGGQFQPGGGPQGHMPNAPWGPNMQAPGTSPFGLPQVVGQGQIPATPGWAQRAGMGAQGQFGMPGRMRGQPKQQTMAQYAGARSNRYVQHQQPGFNPWGVGDAVADKNEGGPPDKPVAFDQPKEQRIAGPGEQWVQPPAQPQGPPGQPWAAPPGPGPAPAAPATPAPGRGRGRGRRIAGPAPQPQQIGGPAPEPQKIEGPNQQQDPRKVQEWERDPRQFSAGIQRTQLNQNPYVWGMRPKRQPQNVQAPAPAQPAAQPPPPGQPPGFDPDRRINEPMDGPPPADAAKAKGGDYKVYGPDQVDPNQAGAVEQDLKNMGTAYANRPGVKAVAGGPGQAKGNGTPQPPANAPKPAAPPQPVVQANVPANTPPRPASGTPTAVAGQQPIAAPKPPAPIAKEPTFGGESGTAGAGDTVALKGNT